MPADAAELTRLRGYLHAAMGQPLTDVWATRCRSDFARRLATETFVAYLVEDSGAVVAGGAGWLEEHLCSPYQLDGRRGHIASMSTDPVHRRRGYGRQVFGALLGWFTDLGVARVDLRATGEGQRLYEQFGFRVLGGATLAWTADGTRPGMPR